MAPSEEADNDITQAPASKRRRVAVACDACRTRKSRCDGVRPRCSLCRDLGFECVYTPPPTSTNVIVQKDYLRGLEERVKRLEEGMVGVRGEIDGLVGRVDGVQVQGVATGDAGSSSSLATARRIEDGSGQRVVSMAGPDLIGTEDSVDAMGAVTFANEEDSGFFGLINLMSCDYGAMANDC